MDEAAPTEHGWYNFFSHDPVTISSALEIKHSSSTSFTRLEWVNKHTIKRTGIEGKYLTFGGRTDFLPGSKCH